MGEENIYPSNNHTVETIKDGQFKLGKNVTKKMGEVYVTPIFKNVSQNM